MLQTGDVIEMIGNDDHKSISISGITKTKSSKRRITMMVCGGVLIFLIGLVIGHFLVGFIMSQRDTNNHKHDVHHTAFIYQEWEKRSVFAPLSLEEMDIVKQTLYEQKIITVRNTRSPYNSLRYDMIYDMHIYFPKKKSVLMHLDNNGTFPGRYALAYLYKGNFSPPCFMEYVVGPLEKGPSHVHITQHRNLSGKTFNKRPEEPREASLVSQLIKREFTFLNPLFSESFDGLRFGHNKGKGIRLIPVKAKISSEKFNERRSSVYLALSSPMPTLDMVPVSAIIHHPGTNSSHWYINNFYYYDQGPFGSAQELMKAYKNKTLNVVKFPDGYTETIKKERHYLQNKTQAPRTNSAVNPPHTVASSHPRYVIKGHQIEWMGWTFELSINTFRGPSIFDIRFKGERIIYEHSLNDLTLLYSSVTIGAGFSNIIMSDIAYKLATKMKYMAGLDCPQYASVVNTSYWANDKGVVKNTFCVFEVDGQRPLWRHMGKYKAGMHDHYLAVRAPAYLGNYDYTLEYEFYIDGKMGTYVTSSGVVYTSHWYDGDKTLGKEKSRTPFGYRVAERGIGSVHDHTFAFKIDFDVINERNRFEYINWKSGNVKDALYSSNSPPSYIPPYQFNSTRYLQFKTLLTENGFQIANTPTFWTILNNKFKNRWGNSRGYMISHTQEYADVLPKDHPILQALPQLKYSCAVTRRKDSEPFVSYSYYDLYDLHHHCENLDSFLNNETVSDTDLVAWLSIHFFHLPTSEDVPITTGARRGFMLKPFNFFDSTATFDMPQYTIFQNGSALNMPLTGTCALNRQ